MTEILPAGTEVAGYRIDSVIGRGGMAVVYRAEDLRLGRKVALKLMAAEFAQFEQFRTRFIRESRLAASLDHPNIIPIYEAGDTDDLLYIVMRYVVGSDLKNVLARDGALEAERAIRLFAQTADALDAAHVHGLVHRDVKPGNILVTAGGEHAEHVYLTDFGLTKRSTSLSGALTRTGHFLGTIDYVAPEQIAGKPVDARADIYALGCVIYESLTGQLPFHRDDDAALLWAHLVEMPPPVTALRADLPREVDAVVARAMAKSPDERYDSCHQLVLDLEDSLAVAQSLRGSRRDAEHRPPTVAASGPAPAPTSSPASASGTDTGEPPQVPESAQHPSFPPGQFDLYADAAETSSPMVEQEVEENSAAEGWTEDPEATGEPPPPPTRRRSRWLVPAVVLVVIAAVLAGLALYLRTRGPDLSQHFTANDRVPFSFDYPGEWGQAGTGVNVVFSPRADVASSLFITRSWSGMSGLLRTDPASATGLYIARSTSTRIDTTSPDTLQEGLAPLLPSDITFTSLRQRVLVGGILADMLEADLNDPAGGGGRLHAKVYLLQNQQDTAVLTFFAAPDRVGSQDELFRGILGSVSFVT